MNKGLVYKGIVIKGSNMLDLVQGVLQTHAVSSKYAPKDWNIFMKAMAELIVPPSVRGSAVNWDLLKHLKVSTVIPRNTNLTAEAKIS